MAATSDETSYPFIVKHAGGQTEGMLVVSQRTVRIELDGQVFDVPLTARDASSPTATQHVLPLLDADSQPVFKSSAINDHEFEITVGNGHARVSFPEGYPSNLAASSAPVGKYGTQQGPLPWVLAIPLSIVFSSGWCWLMSKAMCGWSNIKSWKVWSGGYCAVECY